MLRPHGYCLRPRPAPQSGAAPRGGGAGGGAPRRTGGRGLTALADVALDVAWGQFLSVIGPSGCGKSTLLRAIGGLLRPSRGEVLLDGRPPAHAQRARDTGRASPAP